MAPKKKSGSKQGSLTGSGVFPMLSKTSVAVGLSCLVPGGFWVGTPEADKKKQYKCIVVEFVAMHDFAGRKGAGMRCKEMGESGEGSLEPGAASGDDFIVGYPTPFLEYFYAANANLLPEAMRPPAARPGASETSGTGESPPADDVAAESSNDRQPPTSVKREAKPAAKPPVFEYLNPESSILNTSGVKRGQYTNKYTCNVVGSNGVCGAKITLYSSGDGKSETTSNAWAHLRAACEKCPAHKAALDKLDSANSKRVRNEHGEYVPVHSFEEAFPHHVDYVWCRAAGIFKANTGKKPEFKVYVRGNIAPPPSFLPCSDVLSVCGLQATSRALSFRTKKCNSTSLYASTSCRRRSAMPATRRFRLSSRRSRASGCNSTCGPIPIRIPRLRG